jgi:hypothetical protein
MFHPSTIMMINANVSMTHAEDWNAIWFSWYVGKVGVLCVGFFPWRGEDIRADFRE